MAIGLTVTAAVALAVTAALAAPKVSPPTITAGPSGAVSSTTAAFTYAQSDAGVTYQCAFDGAAPIACGAGSSATKTYTGLSQGSHTFGVTAKVGSTTSSATTRTWTVDTVAPPAPTITRLPDDDDTVAHFRLDDTQSGVTFRCSLDGATAAGCDKNLELKELTAGQHCLKAQAVDAAQNVSPFSATSCWTVLGKQIFDITGSPTGPFFPGHTASLDLTLHNRNSFDIYVESITVTVSPAGGCGSANFATVPFSGHLRVPGNATATLGALGASSATWPTFQMKNLPVNQDVCKSKSFTLTYSGTATK